MRLSQSVEPAAKDAHGLIAARRAAKRLRRQPLHHCQSFLHAVLEFRVLGPVQAVRDGRELALGGPNPLGWISRKT